MKDSRTKKRIIFLIIFLLLLAAEFYIGIFVHDGFFRPYFGDVLVVIVIYALIRIVYPEGKHWLSLAVLVFAVLVEISQIPPLVDLLGIKNRYIRIVMGTSFAWEDITAYAAGTIPTAIYDFMEMKKNKKSPEGGNTTW